MSDNERGIRIDAIKQILAFIKSMKYTDENMADAYSESDRKAMERQNSVMEFIHDSIYAHVLGELVDLYD